MDLRAQYGLYLNAAYSQVQGTQRIVSTWGNDIDLPHYFITIIKIKCQQIFLSFPNEYWTKNKIEKKFLDNLTESE